jgi:hypothetical protein
VSKKWAAFQALFPFQAMVFRHELRLSDMGVLYPFAHFFAAETRFLF